MLKLTEKRKQVKNYVILISVWLLTTLVLSNAFKGLLLSSYVNVKYELAIKSIENLVNKPSVELFHDHSNKIINDMNAITTKEISILLERMQKNSAIGINWFDDRNEIAKLRNGQAVILCNSINCQQFIMFNPHIQFVYTKDHLYHSFIGPMIKKSHPYAKQVNHL